ncbi:hypothetical protein [Sphingomonas jatrophae]|uniref:Uncharacterized protein n=1 Tax=Sphingomonas jatrophae TaxID=1166337 RepID=A0A1I6MBM4_9SPHN|nr:hypothetical protein [Sphingomonas jatrophae]SFS12992.1 hypothetical protein SAMN05192580_3837 [Sphingomonas jatrophae]
MTDPTPRDAAFSDHDGEGEANPVRPAGAESMRDPQKNWDEQDEAVDETFPASDPVDMTPHKD